MAVVPGPVRAPCSPRRADGADHPCTDLNRPAGDVFAAADSTRLWESGRARELGILDVKQHAAEERSDLWPPDLR